MVLFVSRYGFSVIKCSQFIVWYKVKATRGSGQ